MQKGVGLVRLQQLRGLRPRTENVSDVPLLVRDRADPAKAQVFAADVIAATYADPSDRITIVGANQFELLITFLQRGFDDVACVSSMRSVSPRRAAADIVIAPALESEKALEDFLRCLNRALGPGGTVVVRLSEAAAILNQQQLLLVFLKSGFAAVERVAGVGDRGALWLARKHGKISALAA
jgi:hypothetical protein